MESKDSLRSPLPLDRFTGVGKFPSGYDRRQSPFPLDGGRLEPALNSIQSLPLRRQGDGGEMCTRHHLLQMSRDLVGLDIIATY